MIKVKKCLQTCGACPSQWEMESSEGEYLYARYRHGNFSLWLHDYGQEGTCLLQESFGDPLDGYMDFDELRYRTAGILDFSSAEIDNYSEVVYDEQATIDWLSRLKDK